MLNLQMMAMLAVLVLKAIALHVPLRLQLNAKSAQVAPVILALDQPSYMSDRIPSYTISQKS